MAKGFADFLFGFFSESRCSWRFSVCNKELQRDCIKTTPYSCSFGSLQFRCRPKFFCEKISYRGTSPILAPVKRGLYQRHGGKQWLYEPGPDFIFNTASGDLKGSINLEGHNQHHDQGQGRQLCGGSLGGYCDNAFYLVAKLAVGGLIIYAVETGVQCAAPPVGEPLGTPSSTSPEWTGRNVPPPEIRAVTSGKY